MTQTVDSPIVVLFEDRPKQGMVFQLNLSIYLDARVVVASSLKDLKTALAAPDGIHLVVARAQFKGSPLVGRVMEFLAAEKASVPVICLGEAAEQRGLVVLGDEGEVKPLLQAAAKLLGITAKQMVAKQRPDTYEISPDFLKMLFTFPCDVFDRRGGGLEKVFSSGETVPRDKIAHYVQEKRPLVVDAFQRLKLARAVAEQCLKASEELGSASLPEAKKMAILASSLDMVAVQFQNAGMDEETVRLANASIKAVAKIAESATSVGNLVKQLMEANGGYRYAHCQMITFLGFHVIKMMGWWGDEQRAILSQAAIYHDISLSTDEQARIRTAKALAASPLKDPQFEELIVTHPQLAARELQSAPEISPEVVRVVIQHHGSPVGRGFFLDIGKLDNLAKTFILSEEWCDYLMDLAQNDKKADNAARLAELKHLYRDEQSHQILETFRYLDPEEFSGDFLSTKEVDFAASLVSGAGVTINEETVKLVSAEADEPEVIQNINGVTDVRQDEKILVKGGAPQDLVDRSIIKIKGDAQEKERELKMKALADSTDLMRAALGGCLDKITEMLAANASVELRKTDSEGRTAIHYAAMGGSLPVLKELVEKGAQINSADSKRRTALFFAALYKQNEAFDFLLAQGAKINQQAMGGMTIAMIGAYSGNLHILKTAAEKGVRLESKDHMGKTAMDFAKQAKHAKVIAYLESLQAPKPTAEAKSA